MPEDVIGPDPIPEPRTLHASMVAAATAIGPVAKALKNQDSHYNARGIDDVLDSVHGPLADAGIVLTIDVLDRVTETRGKMNYTALRVAYTFHGEDGETLTSTVWGEATDSADKSLAKVMSAALKVLLIQTFTIPVNGDEGDADAHTNDATPNDTGEPAPVMATPEQLDELAALLAEFVARAPEGTKYPAVWVAEGYWPLPRMRRDGCTLTIWETCARITRESIDAFDRIPTTAPTTGDAGYVCPECGTTKPGEHLGGCSEEPF